MDKIHSMYWREGFQVLKVVEEPHCNLKEKENDVEDSTFIVVVDPIFSQRDSESIHESNGMSIIDLRGQYDEVIKENERLSNQLQDGEMYCSWLDVEIASLRCELRKHNNQLF